MIPIPRAPGGYRTHVSDPPWTYNDKGSRIAPDQAIGEGLVRTYRTMDLKAICDMGLEVREVMAPDSLLFLWTTSTHLIEGAAQLVAREWGFEPRSTMVWVKTARWRFPAGWLRALGKMLRKSPERPGAAIEAMAAWLERDLSEPRLKIGGGHYARMAHELILVCRRGKGRVLRHDIPSVIFAPPTRHSAKPERAQDLIERLSPGPYLETFARDWRPGWDGWGDEYPGVPEAA